MKAKAAALFTVTMLLASSVFGCDEACQKEKAEKANNINFASYLSWKFCEDTRLDFMTTTMTSLETYSKKHLDTRYKGGMRNIKQYVAQRKQWLLECNNYMQLTGKGHIFDDQKTTKSIFASIDSVNKELEALISGVTYSNADGSNSTDVILGKFDELFAKVDTQKNLMHMQGRLVYR